jgi:hypothetical protein
MKYLINIIKKFMPKELPKPVGRWRTESCNTKMNHKVDLSNEDHCGPCGQYALEKIELQKIPGVNVPKLIIKEQNSVDSPQSK